MPQLTVTASLFQSKILTLERRCKVKGFSRNIFPYRNGVQ